MAEASSSVDLAQSAPLVEAGAELSASGQRALAIRRAAMAAVVLIVLLGVVATGQHSKPRAFLQRAPAAVVTTAGVVQLHAAGLASSEDCEDGKAARQGKRCTLLITFAKGSSEEVMNNVTKHYEEDADVHLMATVRVALLAYGAEVGDCCKASQKLKSDERLKAVEFDKAPGLKAVGLASR